MSKIGKSKYIAFIVLLVIALASVVIALTGCNSGGSNSSGSSDTGNTGTVCTHEHTVTTSTATCTEAGVETVTCSDCNTVISTKDVAALGHDYESVVTSSTCTAQGYTTYTCSRCDESYVADYTEAGAHNYEAVVTEPTCTTQGYTTHTCSYCNDSYVDTYVAATGHTWDTTAACEDKHCTAEGCTATQAATVSHNYVLTDDTATCTEGGTATYTCSLCNTATYTEASLATGHTFLTDGDGDIIYDDSADTAVLKDKSTCTYTHTHTAYCTTCQKDIEIEYEAVEHNYVLSITDPATCTTAGTKEMKCTMCEAVLEGTAVSYTAEHSYGEGTTDANGNTVYTCSNCSKTKTVYNTASATVDTSALSSDVELSTGTVISMSEEAVSGLGTTSDLTLAADSVTASDLSQSTNLTDEELARVGDSTVYNITLNDGTDNITNFNGTITVKLPYTLAEGEDETNITIFYLSGEELVTISAVYTDGYVVFETDHFSYYTVGKYSAEELCEKYGHNIKISSKAPTCTEAGYYKEICVRCNTVITNQQLAALGHDFDETITKAATCTENGVVTYTCKTCGASYTGVIAATGHTWVLDEALSVAATCTAAGHNHYTCSSCNSTYTADLVQLSHNYTAVVTAATCTEAGYTTYTCSLCGGSYVSDYVAATGHTWNSEAACTDRECLVCGTKLPATAEHTYVEGSTICTVCGGGCSHEYVTTVIDPTCTEYGYTKKVCSICGSVVMSDYVNPLGHSYTKDITKCDNCGATNPNLVTIFNSIIENCYSYDYTLTLSDVTFSATQDYVRYGETYLNEYTVDSATLYISYQDGKIIIYGVGEADYVQTTTYTDSEGAEKSDVEEYYATASIYGDGDYLYIYMESDDEEYIQRISYEYALGDYYDIIFNSEEYMAEYEEVINTYLESDLVQNWITILENNSGLANELAADMFYTLFSGKAVEGGYEFTLNIELLAELNENLKTLTVAELVDEYAGEGAYDALSSYIAGLEDKTLYEVVTEILEYSENFGVDSELVFTTIDTVVTLYTGEEFSIESLLVDDSEESTVIGEMTIAEILAEFVGLEDYSYITDILEEYGALNIYDTLADMMDEEIITFIYETVNSLASSEVIAITFTTDSTYAVTAIKLVLDDAGYTQNSYMASYDEETGDIQSSVYSTFTVVIDGTLDVTYSCELPVGYDTYKLQVETDYAKVLTAIKAACEASESNGTIVLSNYRTLGVNKDGTIYLTSWDETITDISKADILSIEKDCTDAYYVSVESRYYNSEYDYTDYVYGWFYVDTANNKVDTDSFHDYEKIDAPEGVPTSADEVDCEEYYYTYYKCTLCGDVYIESHWKWHDIEVKYTLVNGEGSSCEDGVLVQYVCTECGYVDWYYTTYGHATYSVEVFTLECNSDTVNGTVTYYLHTCACGYSCYLSHYSDGYGCEFNDYSNVETVYDTDNETIIGYTYTYNCYYTGCKNYYTQTVYKCTETYGGDVYTFYQYNDDGTYTTYGPYVMTSSHHETSYNSGSYTDDDGYTVRWWGYYCDFCEYGYTYTSKYDSVGEIYYGYECTDSEGNVTSSWYYQYTLKPTYDEDDNIVEVDCVKTDYYVNDSFRYSYVETDTYDETTDIRTYSRTYTYSDGSTSTTVEKYDGYGREIYYYSAELEDGEVIYYYTYTYTFDDDDLCYALYTYSEGNSDGYEYSESSYGYYHMSRNYFSNNNGTCTQPYTYGYKCSICDGIIYQYTRVNGHDWYYDEELGYYVCSTCGLESEQGSSSEFILEDFTNNSKYGQEGYVTLGYYNPYDSEYVYITYSLVPINSQDSLELSLGYDITEAVEAYVIDNGTIIRISIEALTSIADSYNISLSDYDLRIQFYYTEETDVTAITITDLLGTNSDDEQTENSESVYEFSAFVCTNYNGNDKDVVDAIVESLYEDEDLSIMCEISFVFGTDDTAIVYVQSEAYITGTYVIEEGKITIYYEDGTGESLIFGMFTLSDDGSELSMDYDEIYISGYATEGVELANDTIGLSFVYILAE